MSTQRTILITNDDGYDAPGINHLAEVMRPYGKIVVVAPMEAQSGMSHALTIKHPLRVKKITEKENFSVFSCSGTPVDCVKIALDRILGSKPDLIVSGINHGNNTSVSVFYSGTVSAAVEGCLNGIDSFGFSLNDLSHDADFSAAKVYVKKIMDMYVEGLFPKRFCFNVNIPKTTLENIRGIRFCRQTDGLWVERFDKRTDPGMKDYYWLTGSFFNFEEDANDTDEWAMHNQYVAVVPLQIDMTDYKQLEQLAGLNH